MKVTVVIDANILFRTLISHGIIVTLFFHEDIKIYSPKKLKEEFLKNQQEISEKSKLSKEEFDELYKLLFEQIIFIDINEYKEHLHKAEELLCGHIKDAEFIAICISRNIKLWTYEKRIFEIGYGISTREIAKKLYT